ncbi:MAG TPA: DNA-primase RepB domain-containing protein [Bryobacteraceae bacterium]|nr:DNA-primase RepB domain-containing protein [Bryobacteraceae bacterium]
MDADAPIRYLRDNFQPEDRLAVVLINKETERVVQRVATAEAIAKPEFQAWLRFRNAHHDEVYLSMNTLKETASGRTRDEISAIRHIYLDFDHNGTAAVKELMAREDIPEPNYLVNSSPNKWQVVWKVEGFERDQAERLQRHLVRETGADPAATDSSRVLRLPGYYNHKYAKPFYVRAEARSAAIHRPEHFPEPPAEGHGGRNAVTVSNRSGGSHHNGITQSERDWSYAKRALARGDAREQVVAAIIQYRNGEKRDVAGYARRTVDKAEQALKNPPSSDREGLRGR